MKKFLSAGILTVFLALSFSSTAVSAIEVSNTVQPLKICEVGPCPCGQYLKKGCNPAKQNCSAFCVGINQ